MVKTLQGQIQAELSQARLAQQQGNEGKARVCARRAAGIAIRAWSGQPGDALKQLQRLQNETAVPETVRAAARRLATKVDYDHKLPFDNDPVEDARMIIAHCEAAEA